MTALMDTVRTSTDPRSLERSFEVESPGGHARTVVGRLAYFDEEAQTYMVLTRSGGSSGFRCETSQVQVEIRGGVRSLPTPYRRCRGFGTRQLFAPLDRRLGPCGAGSRCASTSAVSLP
jgi:hypothetical protein